MTIVGNNTLHNTILIKALERVESMMIYKTLIWNILIKPYLLVVEYDWLDILMYIFLHIIRTHEQFYIISQEEKSLKQNCVIYFPDQLFQTTYTTIDIYFHL